MKTKTLMKIRRFFTYEPPVKGVSLSKIKARMKVVQDSIEAETNFLNRKPVIKMRNNYFPYINKKQNNGN